MVFEICFSSTFVYQLISWFLRGHVTGDFFDVIENQEIINQWNRLFTQFLSFHWLLRKGIGRWCEYYTTFYYTVRFESGGDEGKKSARRYTFSRTVTAFPNTHWKFDRLQYFLIRTVSVSCRYRAFMLNLKLPHKIMQCTSLGAATRYKGTLHGAPNCPSRAFKWKSPRIFISRKSHSFGSAVMRWIFFFNINK